MRQILPLSVLLLWWCLPDEAKGTIQTVKDEPVTKFGVRVATEELHVRRGEVVIDFSGLNISYQQKATTTRKPRDSFLIIDIVAFPVPSDTVVCSKRSKGYCMKYWSPYGVGNHLNDTRSSTDYSKNSRLWPKMEFCREGRLFLDPIHFMGINTSVAIATAPATPAIAAGESSLLGKVTLPRPNTSYNEQRDWTVHVILFNCGQSWGTFGKVVAEGSIKLFYHYPYENHLSEERYLPPLLLQLYYWNCFLWLCYACLVVKNILGYFQWKQRARQLQRKNNSTTTTMPKLSWIQSLILSSLVTRSVALLFSMAHLYRWDTTGQYSLALALSENVLDLMSHALLGLFCVAMFVNPILAFFGWRKICFHVFCIHVFIILFLGLYYSGDFSTSWAVSSYGMKQFYPDWYNPGNAYYGFVIGLLLMETFEMLWWHRRLPNAVRQLARNDNSCRYLDGLVQRYLQSRQWLVGWILVTMIAVLLVGGILPIETLQSWIRFQMVRGTVNLVFVVILSVVIHPMKPDDPLVGDHFFVVHVTREYAHAIIWKPPQDGKNDSDDHQDDDDGEPWEVKIVVETQSEDDEPYRSIIL